MTTRSRRNLTMPQAAQAAVTELADTFASYSPPRHARITTCRESLQQRIYADT